MARGAQQPAHCKFAWPYVGSKQLLNVCTWHRRTPWEGNSHQQTCRWATVTLLMFIRFAAKSTIWCTTKRRKEHDETWKRARFGARQNEEKSAIWCTTKRRKKHALEHDGTQKRARFGARRNAEKSTIWYLTGHCFTKPEPHHDDVRDE